MDQFYVDATVSFLWMYFLYPGLIIFACLYCHAMRDEIKSSINSPENQRPPSGYVRGQDSVMNRPDPPPVIEDDGPSTSDDSKIPSMPSMTTKSTLAAKSSAKNSDGMQQCQTSLRLAFISQIVQAYLLQRLASTATGDYTKRKRPGTIFIGFFTLSICTIIVLRSLFVLRQSWGLVAKQTGKGTTMSNLFVLLMVGAISLPWYNLSSASRQ